MRVGIVGSRRRNTLADRQMILDLVRDLKEKFGESLVLVSGGCKTGADHYAEEAAVLHGVPIVLHPVKGKFDTRWQFAQAAFARNEDIVKDSDVVFAQVASDRKGGTENTLGHCVTHKKPRWLIDEQGAILAPEEWPHQTS